MHHHVSVKYLSHFDRHTSTRQPLRGLVRSLFGNRRVCGVDDCEQVSDCSIRGDLQPVGIKERCGYGDLRAGGDRLWHCLLSIASFGCVGDSFSYACFRDCIHWLVRGLFGNRPMCGVDDCEQVRNSDIPAALHIDRVKERCGVGNGDIGSCGD